MRLFISGTAPAKIANPPPRCISRSSPPPGTFAVSRRSQGSMRLLFTSGAGGAVDGGGCQAIGGNIVVDPEDWNDAAQSGGAKNPDAKDDATSAEASMFFVYYAKRGTAAAQRPITFVFNGGPGSSTVWL